MHEEKPTGKLDTKQEAEIDDLRQRVSDLEHALGEDAGWFDRAKKAEAELGQARIDMANQHKIARDMVQRHEQETLRLLAEIEAWKDASGLERGGDPDGVTPGDLRSELDHLRTTQEKSWGAADEVLCAQYEAVIRDLVDTCDVLMGDSDLPDDDSKAMVAMRRAAAILNNSPRRSETNVKLGRFMTAYPVSNGRREPWAIKDPNGHYIAYLEWYAPWRQYVMNAESTAVFSHDCLSAIACFCKRLTGSAKHSTRLTAEAVDSGSKDSAPVDDEGDKNV